MYHFFLLLSLIFCATTYSTNEKINSSMVNEPANNNNSNGSIDYISAILNENYPPVLDMFAAMRGRNNHEELLLNRIFVAHHCRTDQQKRAGVLTAALAHEIYRGNLKTVKILVDHGANVNGDEGHPLMVAVQNRYIHIIEFLLEHKADPNQLYKKSFIINGNKKIASVPLILVADHQTIRTLLMEKMSPQALNTYIPELESRLVKILIQKGKNAQELALDLIIMIGEQVDLSVDNDANTFLHILSKAPALQLEVIQNLLYYASFEAYKNIPIKETLQLMLCMKNNQGDTPLHIALKNIRFCKEEGKQGASPDAKQIDYAVQLINLGSSLDARNNQQFSCRDFIVGRRLISYFSNRKALEISTLSEGLHTLINAQNGVQNIDETFLTQCVEGYNSIGISLKTLDHKKSLDYASPKIKLILLKISKKIHEKNPEKNNKNVNKGKNNKRRVKKNALTKSPQNKPNLSESTTAAPVAQNTTTPTPTSPLIEASKNNQNLTQPQLTSLQSQASPQKKKRRRKRKPHNNSAPATSQNMLHDKKESQKSDQSTFSSPITLVTNNNDTEETSSSTSNLSTEKLDNNPQSTVAQNNNHETEPTDKKLHQTETPFQKVCNNKRSSQSNKSTKLKSNTPFQVFTSSCGYHNRVAKILNFNGTPSESSQIHYAPPHFSVITLNNNVRIPHKNKTTKQTDLLYFLPVLMIDKRQPKHVSYLAIALANNNLVYHHAFQNIYPNQLEDQLTPQTDALLRLNYQSVKWTAKKTRFQSIDKDVQVEDMLGEFYSDKNYNYIKMDDPHHGRTMITLSKISPTS